MADLIDSITPENLTALQTALDQSRTTIDGLNSTITTQGATITDLTARLNTAEGKLADPNLMAAWDRAMASLAALQAVLVPPSPAPQS